MRVAQPVILSEEVRRKLEQQSRGRSTQSRVVLRSRIVLLAAAGLQNKQIAAALKVAPRMAALWRSRFLEHGIEGLLQDAPRPGRTPTICRASLIDKTTRSITSNATQWSTHTMAREMGISKASVSRIWRASGLKPHRVESFKVSNDPQFAEKLEAIVGLYLNPPEHALVLSVDEKSQIQALDPTQPGLPLKKGRCQTMTHDYKRNGTTTLFAALNMLDGAVIGQCMQRHRHQEWLRFLRQIDAATPKDKALHLIADNYATHKHPKVKVWLAKHPRFHMHFTPTSASWLNMVERFFRDISENRLRRGVFHNVAELEQTIDQYVAHHNRDPKPFIWTASASDILAKVMRARKRLNKLQSV